MSDMKLLGLADEPQQSGAVVAVHYGDYRRQEGERLRAAGRRGTRSDRAEQRFRNFVHAAGGVILEDAWLGAMYRHHVRCSAGHEREVVPNSLTGKGRRGFCRVCARQDPETAESAFKDRVALMGGVVLEPSWRGSTRPHRVRCAAGHETFPIPGNVARGQGICRGCAGNDSESARQQFHARIADLGGSVLAEEWAGVDALHPVKCAKGHRITVRPGGLTKMKNLCSYCAGRAPEVAAARFRARVTELGGEVLEDQWLGGNIGHRIRCGLGHITAPRPNHVLSGSGICRACAGKTWDVFYVVTNREVATLKFGVTSGSPKPRLADHAHDGFRDVALLLESLADGTAVSMERAARKAMRAAGHRPVRGHEYFHLDTKDLVIAAAAAAYVQGWRAGRRDLWQSMESIAEDDPREGQ